MFGSSVAEYYSCALNGGCPPPLWEPTYNLTLSTICQPGGSSNADYFIPPPNKPWGFISLDWSVASNIWKNTTNMSKSTEEATSIKNCQMIKSAFPNTRCMIYHNMELALQAFESQRKVMYNPQYSDWFLQYTYGNGTKNGTIYNEPGGPGDQYFWDYRITDVADYYITSIISTVSDPAVDGSFTDDVTGLPAEHPNAPGNMNLTAQEVLDIEKATQETNDRLIMALIEAGKYNWQAFGYQDGIGSGITQSGCLDFMRNGCDKLNGVGRYNKDYNYNYNYNYGNSYSYSYSEGNYTMIMTFDANNTMQSLAAFLIIRPKYAWLGYGWESDMSDWNDVFLYDVGEPKGTCVEIVNGTFQREWSYGNVTIDCNNWQATVPHQ